MKSKLLAENMLWVAAFLIVYGCWLAWEPLGWVTGGIWVVIVSWGIHSSGEKAEEKARKDVSAWHSHWCNGKCGNRGLSSNPNDYCPKRREGMTFR